MILEKRARVLSKPNAETTTPRSRQQGDSRIKSTGHNIRNIVAYQRKVYEAGYLGLLFSEGNVKSKGLLS
jgi:hypothetical protein